MSQTLETETFNKKILLNVPRTLNKEIDEIVARAHYSNRSDALRTAIREFVDRHREKDKVVP